jgi:outer membrane protein OmpA-like peptidoglycan-associated protein
MMGRVTLEYRRNALRFLTQGRAACLAVLLSACSSVPDAVNPVEWYKGASDMITGKDRPEVASPGAPKGQYPDINAIPQRTADTRKDLPKGLVADRGNAKYAQPVQREVTPTKPLARRTPAPSEGQVAAAAPQGVVPPKSEVQTSELPGSPQLAQAAQPNQPRVDPNRRQPTARGDLGPDAPPPSVNMQPPAPADVPLTVPMPGRGKLKPIQEQFQKRLAESAQTTVYPGMVEMPRPISVGGTYAGGPSSGAYSADDAPIHLVPPGSGKRGSGFGGGKGLAAPPPAPAPAASFQVASVDFSSGSDKLTAADRTAIADVAKLYKQTGGVVRVVGYAPAAGFGGGDQVRLMMSGLDASNSRAVAVARELSRRGVPAGKIMVAADPGAAGMGGSGAQVYLDVM